jgi:hypothetical protein
VNDRDAQSFGSKQVGVECGSRVMISRSRSRSWRRRSSSGPACRRAEQDGHVGAQAAVGDAANGVHAGAPGADQRRRLRSPSRIESHPRHCVGFGVGLHRPPEPGALAFSSAGDRMAYPQCVRKFTTCQPTCTFGTYPLRWILSKLAGSVPRGRPRMSLTVTGAGNWLFNVEGEARHDLRVVS